MRSGQRGGATSEAPGIRIRRVELFERPVRLRLPFRFGAATVTRCPQAFVRIEIEQGGRAFTGASAELMVPKWFDKSPALTHEQNFEQLREALRVARAHYASCSDSLSPWGLSQQCGEAAMAQCLGLGLPRLVAQFGVAQLDKAVADAALRAAGRGWVEGVQQGVLGDPFQAALRLQRADSVLLRARADLGGTGDLQLELAQTRAAMGQWEESARAWRVALASASYLEQAAAYALTPAPSTTRDAIRAQLFAPPVAVSARRALATLEAAWGSPANGWLALRDLMPDSAAAAAWLDFAQRAEAEERWTHAREALSNVLRWRRTPEIALRAAVAALNSGDPGGALQLAPLTSGGADSARVARTLLPVHVRALAALGRPATAERLVASYERWLTPTSRATLARSIAFGWVRIGDMTRARGALTVAGPDADSSDAAGWLALYAGDIKTARRLLRAGGDASPELALALGLVARVTADSSPALGQAFLILARGDSAAAATAFAESTERLPEVASLLLYTAAQLRMGTKNDSGAIPLWKRVVEQYASSAEAPASDLEWARALKRMGNSAGAIARLEHLILSYPTSALVPQARRDLDLMRSSIP